MAKDPAVRPHGRRADAVGRPRLRLAPLQGCSARRSLRCEARLAGPGHRVLRHPQRDREPPMRARRRGDRKARLTTVAAGRTRARIAERAPKRAFPLRFVATLDAVTMPRTASQVLGLTLNGRYRVIEPISAGAMGAVYRATDIRDRGRGRAQAVAPTRTTTSGSRSRRGCSRASQHPRVVRILDHFSRGSGQFLVMDLVRGLDLGMLLKQRGAPGLPARAVDRVRPPGVRSAPVRARPADRPSGRQATEHDPRRAGHRAGRLRHRPADGRGGAAGHRRDRHAPVHGPRGLRGRPASRRAPTCSASRRRCGR